MQYGSSRPAQIGFATARIVLGLIFILLGINGFVPFIPNPPSVPQIAMTFFIVLAQTHYAYVVFGVQVLCGILLAINRYVTFALVGLGAVIVNILTFHITMWPQSLFPMPLLVTVLWLITAWRYRDRLNVLLRP